MAPNCSTGCAASGRRVKSGQMTPLKTCRRSAAMVAASACTRTGGRLRGLAAAGHAVGQQADGQHVVEVRMA